MDAMASHCAARSGVGAVRMDRAAADVHTLRPQDSTYYEESVDKSAGGGQAACGADSRAGAQHDDDVGVLLMDSTGALGLDLSFVAWVFLMEPLEDASQLLQVAPPVGRQSWLIHGCNSFCVWPRCSPGAAPLPEAARCSATPLRAEAEACRSLQGFGCRTPRRGNAQCSRAALRYVTCGTRAWRDRRQVISRAHRMGAPDTVRVEVLAMKARCPACRAHAVSAAR